MCRAEIGELELRLPVRSLLTALIVTVGAVVVLAGNDFVVILVFSSRLLAGRAANGLAQIWRRRIDGRQRLHGAERRREPGEARSVEAALEQHRGLVRARSRTRR